MNSIFINYFRLTQHTRFLFLFRRLNKCQHKYSCIERILRKSFDWLKYYMVLRVPLYGLMSKIQGEGENVMDYKGFIIGEIAMLIMVGGLNSAGCFIKYMNEEVIEQS
jgi:hypothetical protein